MPLYSNPAIAANSPTPGQAGHSNNVIEMRFPIAVTAALTTADTFSFGFVPRGFRLLGGYLKASDMDTNGSPTLAINVGDAGSATRIFSASNVGQAGTAAAITAATALGFQYTDRTLITGAVSANAATGVAGTLELVLLGAIEGLAS